VTAVAGLMLDVQRRLESLYALEPVQPVSEFLIPAGEAGRYPGGGSRTLLAQDGDSVSLGVILDEDVSATLAESDPRERLDRLNLGPFCTLAEEVSHFLLLLFCARAARSVTELELELQGEIDKYLSAALLLSLQNEGAVSSRLRGLLFRNYRLLEGLTPERAERYHAANQLADRWCGHLEARYLRGQHFPELVREARRFYRLGQREKLERIARIQLH
jgi:hypothetical protein